MIEKLMREIVMLENPQIFSIQLMKTDHNINWSAHANLRADKRNFSVDHVKPEKALEELLKVLKSTICHHCSQVIPEDLS